jgi:proteasome lid subunit RPN8/RPN11
MSQPPAELFPVWHPHRGAPFVGGVRIEMSGPTGQRHVANFPLDCFKAEAKRISGEHVAAGTLKDGEIFTYRVLAARPQQLALPSGRMSLLDVEEIEQPLVMTESSLQDFLDRSMSLGATSETDDDVLSVFVAQALVAQCVDLVRAAGELETGGILIGRLRRDPSAGAAGVFLEITAQIPAQHTDQRKMRVTFTDRTWAAARDALALRQSDESIVGWFHSHPDFCGKCAAEKRATCSLNEIFFSSTDVSLHRTMFPRAWQVGLLFSNRPAGIIPALYGWQQAVVASRPFHLLAPPNEVLDPHLLNALGAVEGPILATVGGDEHGNTH